MKTKTIFLFICLILLIFVSFKSLTVDTKENNFILSNNVKVVVFVPTSYADVVREAMGRAGAGVIGNYGYCSFSVKGQARYKPLEGANPAIVESETMAGIPEERIETIMPKEDIHFLIEEIKKVHPYEEVGIDIHPLIEYKTIQA